MLPRMAKLWSGWRQRLSRARSHARLREDLRYELRCLDEAGELDGALANLGFSRAAIPTLVRSYPGSVRRHAMMARRLGVRPAAPRAGLGALMGSRRRCLFCRESRRCERWLAAGEGAPTFCPNVAAFERMKTSR
jgi:hypothetical protein